MAKDEWQNLGLIFAKDEEVVAKTDKMAAEKGD